MKVLFLNHPESDYLEAVLYMGLCEELGADNVVDFPYKPSYHGQTHTYPSTYAGEEGKTGVTSPFMWMPISSRAASSRDWVLSELSASRFDLMIVASPRSVSVSVAVEIFKMLGRDRMPPVVFVDGEDYSDLRWDLIEKLRPCIYLKRELMAGEEMRFQELGCYRFRLLHQCLHANCAQRISMCFFRAAVLGRRGMRPAQRFAPSSDLGSLAAPGRTSVTTCTST